MRHASAAALDRIETLLAQVRATGLLREKSRGVFYLRSRAFLHFHEDPAGIFADVRSLDGSDFDRLRVDEAGGPDALIARIALHLSSD
jgi:hypothetical protein